MSHLGGKCPGRPCRIPGRAVGRSRTGARHDVGAISPEPQHSLRSRRPRFRVRFFTPLKGEPMAVEAVYISRYDQRVKLVAAALTQNSELTEDVAVELAKHVLDALDHIPEKVR